MSQQLINHSPDLKRLRDEGYVVETIKGYLVVHDIPYVNNQKDFLYGKLIVQLSIEEGIAKYANNHVAYFMGQYPCNKDGSSIEGIRHGSCNQAIREGLIMNFSFSNKPQGGYKDHYEQVSRYVKIISDPACAINPNLTAKTFRTIEDTDDENVFQYTDTNESRANIVSINNKFRGQKIAIIGLGGTGSYILDLVAKTPVEEIHLFDGDVFSQHNAFRCPGAAMKEDIDSNIPKVTYLHKLYSNIHKGIFAHDIYVTEQNINELMESISYIFICVDSNNVRGTLIKSLVKMNKIFIDVGLGIQITNDEMLIGTTRVTTGSPEKYDHLSKRVSLTKNDDNVVNEYNTNIQIADLNALNAVMAVIKWKKMSNFYQDITNEYHSTYTINDGELINEDEVTNA